MDRWVFSFITGVISSLIWPELPNPIYLSLLGAFAWFALPSRLSVPISGTLIGAVWIASLGHWYQYWQYSLSQNTQLQQVEGTVLSVRGGTRSTQLDFRVDRLNGQKVFLSPKLRLRWQAPDEIVLPGQARTLSVRLKPANGFANEGVFLYQTWLASGGFVGTGYVLDGSSLANAAPETAYRHQIKRQFEAGSSTQVQWLLALAIGDRSRLTDEDWQRLQHTGIGHLLAISGLHLGLVVILFVALLKPLLLILSKLGAISQKHNFYVLQLWAGVLVAFLYLVLAGANLPVQRAWLALLIWVVVVSLRRHCHGGKILAAVIALLLLLWPLSVLSISFWLTVIAVSSLIFAFWRWPGRFSQRGSIAGIKSFFLLQGWLSAIMLPASGYFFAVLPLAGYWLNLIAVPVVSMFLLPLVIIITLTISGPEWLHTVLIGLFDSLVTMGNNWLSYFSDKAVFVADIPDVPLACYALGLLAMLLATLPALPFNKFWLLALLLPITSYFLPLRTNIWYLHVLDVGQGLAVVVQYREYGIIYDTGASFPSGFTLAEGVVLPFLQARGMTAVEHLFVSHHDNDHAGGLSVVTKAYPEAVVWQTRDTCVAPNGLLWHGLTVEVLWPLSPSVSSNANSCVVRLTGNGKRVLLTGDIDKQTERVLITRYGEEGLNADILIAPHHGSDTSSSSAFIRTVSPAYVVFSEGFMNQWGFPAQKVVNRYQALKIRMLSTSEAGQVSFSMPRDGADIEIATFRQHIRPTWYLKAPF